MIIFEIEEEDYCELLSFPPLHLLILWRSTFFLFVLYLTQGPWFATNCVCCVERMQGSWAVCSFEAQMVDDFVDIGIQQRAVHLSVFSIWGPKLVLLCFGEFCMHNWYRNVCGLVSQSHFRNQSLMFFSRVCSLLECVWECYNLSKQNLLLNYVVTKCSSFQRNIITDFLTR